MIRTLAALTVLYCLSTPSSYGAEPDTQLAAKVRAEKLKVKITADFKNEMLKEIFKDFSAQIEAKKLGVLSFAPETGVSMNSRVTYKCADKPLEEVLDEMFKPLDLGYYVVSKEKDRYDGWIKVNKSSDRGTQGSAEMKKEDPKKVDPKKKEDPKKVDPKKKEDPKKAPDEDKPAKDLLTRAQLKIDLKKNDDAKELLEELLKKYPDGKSAEAAKVMLEKLGK